MENKIKLLRVVTQAEVVPWHLHNFIIRAKADYDLFITGNEVSKYKNDYPNVTFIDNEIFRKISFYGDLKALFKLVKTCRQIKPDIIHSIMPKSGLVAALAGLVSLVPIRVHTYTGQVWSTKTGFSRIFFRFLDKIIFNLNTKCLTDSPSQSNFLANNGFLKNEVSIPYLGKGSLTGVDLNQYHTSLVNVRNELRKELGIAADDFVYGFFARKSLSKGLEFLFESFALIANKENVKLLMVGADESEGHLTRLMEKHTDITNKIISLEKAFPHENYLALCDVLCSPSSSEGFGSIVIEAAAMGIPTVGFEVLGLIDSVENNFSGILVPFGDIDSFTNAMVDLYQDREKLEQMKQNAKKRVMQFFSADKIYELQGQFYKNLLAKKKMAIDK